MARQQVYWNQRQVAVPWTESFIYATGSPPPRKSTVAYFTPIHQPFNDTRCGVVVLSCHIARGSTSHNVLDVDLEEKDTEGGEKDKVQLDGLTDRVIV